MNIIGGNSTPELLLYWNLQHIWLHNRLRKAHCEHIRIRLSQQSPRTNADTKRIYV